MKKDSYNIAIVGATGVVGQELINILQERKFPFDELRLLASERSEGKEVAVNGNPIKIQKLSEDSFNNIDIALFSAGSERSKQYADAATKCGTIIIDNSSAFRMDPQVPLVIPEINSSMISDYKNKGIIANPNCTTAISVMALKPLHDLARIKRVVATSFQSVSGAGAQGIYELEEQTHAWATSDALVNSAFPYQIAFNVIPQIDSFTENLYTKEEMKLHNETRKILGDDSIQLTATTVRVPVLRVHSIAINIECENKITVEEARKAINRFPGVTVIDEPENAKYPMPINASCKDDCLVGRIREDYTVENGLSFWVVGDQLRKGAALNAVQIAEELIKEYV